MKQLDPDYDDIAEDLPEDEEDDRDHPSLTPAQRNPSLTAGTHGPSNP